MTGWTNDRAKAIKKQIIAAHSTMLSQTSFPTVVSSSVLPSAVIDQSSLRNLRY